MTGIARPARHRRDGEPAGKGPFRAGRAAWLFGGNAVYALGQWLTLISIARFGDPEMVGEYALGLAISAPVVLVASLALRTVQATDARYRFSFGEYLSLRIVAMAGAFAVIATMAGFLPGALATVVILVGLAKCCDGVGDIFYGAFQRSERMAPIGISMAANGSLTFTFVTIMLEWQGVLSKALWGSVTASVLSSIVYCTLAIRQSPRCPADVAAAGRATIQSRQRTAAMLSLGRFALPLGMASGLTSLNANIPRYVLEARAGASALGVFTAITVIVLALNTLVGAVAQSMLPSFSRAFATDGPRALRSPLLRLMVISAAVGVILTAVGILAGEPLLAWIYGTEYAQQLPVLVWMVAYAGIATATWFVDAALSACGRFGSQLRIGAVGFGLVAITTWPLVGAFGTAGAAVALFVSGTAQLAMKLWRFLDASQVRPRRA